MLIGWPETGRFPWPVETVMEKELDVVGVNRYCNAYPRAIDLIRCGLVRTGTLVSHRFLFRDVVEAFHAALTQRTEVIKIMVGPAGRVVSP